MGRIIDRVRRRQTQVRFRRIGGEALWGFGGPLWGIGAAELRQPEEQTKNEAMRQRVEDLPTNGIVWDSPLPNDMPTRP